MLGKSHLFVAYLSLAYLSQKERHILYPRWGGIESGVTLSDEFRIMWEPVKSGSKSKQLVHRCYVDSNDPKNHGCITRASDHFEGCISFINDYLNGDLENSYNEVEFLENLGMFLGITSHHIADLCTPVHVGHKINYKKMGYSTLTKLHNKVERDILQYQNQACLRLSKPRLTEISDNFFWRIAKETYKNSFLELENIYEGNKLDDIVDMCSQVLTNAVRYTIDVWHSVLYNSQMTEKNWSLQPLL